MYKVARCIMSLYGDGTCDAVNNHFGCGFDGGDCCSYTVELPDDELPFCDTMTDDDDSSGRRLEEESANDATEQAARDPAGEATQAAVKAAATVVAEASTTEPARIAGIGDLLISLYGAYEAALTGGPPKDPAQSSDNKHEVQVAPSSRQPWRGQGGSSASSQRKLLVSTAPSPLPTSVPTSAPTDIPSPVPTYSYSYDPDCARTCFGVSCNVWVATGDFTCDYLEE